MADVSKTLRFTIIGDASSAAKALQQVGKEGESAANSLIGHFKGVGAGIQQIFAGDVKGGLAALRGEAAAIGTSLQGGVKLGAAGITALGVAATAAAVKIGADSVSTFKTVAGEVLNLQRVVGGTAEDASRLRFAFKETGVDADKGAALIAKFSKALETATPGTSAEAAMIAKLGFAYRDANGHILPMSEILPKIAQRFAEMPGGAEKTALALQLFGKSGAELLPFLNKGEAGLAALAQRADEFGLTLSGQNLQALIASKQAQKDWDATMQGLQVTIGANLLPIVTSWAQTVNGLLPILRDATDTSTGLGKAVQMMAIAFGAILAIKGVVAVVDLVKTGFTSAQGALASFAASLAKAGQGSAALTGLAGGIARLGSALPVVGIAVGVLAAVWASFTAAADKARQRTEDLTSALKSDSGTVGDNTRAYIANALAKDGTSDAARRLGIDLKTLADAAAGDKSAIDQVTAATKQYMDASNAAHVSGQQHADAKAVQEALGSMNRELDAAKQKTADIADMEGVAAGSAQDMADAARDAAAAAKEQANAMFDQANAALALSGNEIAYEKAMDDATEAIRKNGATLDLNTEKGRDNQAAINNMARTALAVIQAQIGMGASADQVVPKMEQFREAVVAAAMAAGLDEAAANALADSYHMIPADVQTAVTQQGAAAAQKAAEDFLLSLQNLPPERRAEILSIFHDEGIAAARAAVASIQDKTVTITVNTVNGMSTSTRGGVTNADGGIWDFYASGGLREDHRAQIAPAGAWRVWAEPETGGEAYLPLAPSKRARTIPIAQEAVRRLGGVAYFGSGGITGSASGGDIHLHISLPPGADPHSNARAIVASLRALKRSEGTLAVSV